MNIKDYISSGIIESCVLGLASHEEQLEFDQLCATNAELRQAKEAFEASLEKFSLDNAVAPPAALKQKIWDTIKPVEDSETPVVNMQSAPVRSFGFLKFLTAAAVVLLVASTALNFYFYDAYKSSSAKLNDLIAANQQLTDNNSTMQTKLQEYERSFAMIKDTNMAVIAMKGQPVAPQSATTVYWNKQTNDVYLLVNALPQPAAGKQYQLWAIVDGKPVDAGLLTPGAADALVKMKSIAKVQAFAITLENIGGSKAPTMPIYVVGKT